MRRLASTRLFIHPFGRDDQLWDAIDTWSTFVRPRQEVDAVDRCSSNTSPNLLFRSDCNAPLTALAWQLGVDTAVLVPGFGILLALLVLWGHNEIALRRSNILSSADPGVTSLIGRLLLWKPWIVGAVWLMVLADWLENTFTLWTITNGWIASNAR